MPIGRPGRHSAIRELRAEAERLFRLLAEGGIEESQAGYPGRLVRLPSGGWVGYRPRSKGGVPTIDVNIAGVEIEKLKFLEPGS